MPMEYLQTLKPEIFPFVEVDMANIDKLRVLRAAGMVEVELPPVDSPRQNAQVLYITGLGCATLRARGALAPVPRRAPLGFALEASWD